MKRKARKVLAWLVIYVWLSVSIGAMGDDIPAGFASAAVLFAFIAAIIWAIGTLSDDTDAP